MFGSRSITDQSTDIEKLTQKLDTAVKAGKTYYWPWETSPSRIHSQLEKKISNIEKAISNQNSGSSASRELIALNIEKARMAISDYNTANKTRKMASSFFTKVTNSDSYSKETSPSSNAQINLSVDELKSQYRKLLEMKGLSPEENKDPILKLDKKTATSVFLKSIAQITRILDSIKEPEIVKIAYGMFEKIDLSQNEPTKKIESLKLRLDLFQKLREVLPTSTNNEELKDLGFASDISQTTGKTIGSVAKNSGSNTNAIITRLLNSENAGRIARNLIHFIKSIENAPESERLKIWNNLLCVIGEKSNLSKKTSSDVTTLICTTIENSYGQISKENEYPIVGSWIQKSYITKTLEDLEIPEEKAPPILFNKSIKIEDKGRLLSALEEIFTKENTEQNKKTKVLEYCQRLSTIPKEGLKQDLENLITSPLPPSQFFVQEKLKIAFNVQEGAENNKQIGIPSHSKVYNTAIDPKNANYKKQLFQRMADVIEHLERTGNRNKIAAFFKKFDETDTPENRRNPDFFADLANQVIKQINNENGTHIPLIRLTWKEWFALNFQ